MADFWSFYLCFSIFYSILIRVMSKILKQGRGGLEAAAASTASATTGEATPAATRKAAGATTTPPRAPAATTKAAGNARVAGAVQAGEVAHGKEDQAVRGSSAGAPGGRGA